MTVPFCSTPLIYGWDFSVQLWVVHFQKNFKTGTWFRGATRMGRCVKTIPGSRIHLMCMYGYFPLSHVVLGAGNTNVNKPSLCPWSEDSGKNWASAHYPKGPPWAEGWSLWDSIQPEKDVTTGVYRQWHGWLNRPGATAAHMLEDSLREPETKSGGFTYPGGGGGKRPNWVKALSWGDFTANTVMPQSQSSCC